jgi:hypothetical protein
MLGSSGKHGNGHHSAACRTTADNVRQPSQWLQQIGRSSGENLVAADLPAFYRHRELKQQLAGHQSRRSSASSARLLGGWLSSGGNMGTKHSCMLWCQSQTNSSTCGPVACSDSY